MSNRIVAALGAATLTVGILVGAAGAVLVAGATGPNGQGMNASMGQMMNTMGGSMMAGVDFGDMAELHPQHHGTDR